MQIFVDADACLVVDIIEKIAEKYKDNLPAYDLTFTLKLSFSI